MRKHLGLRLFRRDLRVYAKIAKVELSKALLLHRNPKTGDPIPHALAGVQEPKGGMTMEMTSTARRTAAGLSRRELLKAVLATGAMLSAWPLYTPASLWGAEAGPPRRGGILRVRGYDPVHFDLHLTISFKTHTTLSFVYSRLVRHKVGADVQPGTFILEPDLAERWEDLDDTTYIFHIPSDLVVDRWDS